MCVQIQHPEGERLTSCGYNKDIIEWVFGVNIISYGTAEKHEVQAACHYGRSSGGAIRGKSCLLC